MLEVVIQDFKDLTPYERDTVSNNGAGKEYAGYLRVIHNNKSIRLESDAMEPEDVKFYRDLDWVKTAIMEAYRLGVEDANGSR